MPKRSRGDCRGRSNAGPCSSVLAPTHVSNDVLQAHRVEVNHDGRGVDAGRQVAHVAVVDGADLTQRLRGESGECSTMLGCRKGGKPGMSVPGSAGVGEGAGCSHNVRDISPCCPAGSAAHRAHEAARHGHGMHGMSRAWLQDGMHAPPCPAPPCACPVSPCHAMPSPCHDTLSISKLIPAPSLSGPPASQWHRAAGAP